MSKWARDERFGRFVGAYGDGRAVRRTAKVAAAIVEAADPDDDRSPEAGDEVARR